MLCSRLGKDGGIAIAAPLGVVTCALGRFHVCERAKADAVQLARSLDMSIKRFGQSAGTGRIGERGDLHEVFALCDAR